MGLGDRSHFAVIGDDGIAPEAHGAALILLGVKFQDLGKASDDREFQIFHGDLEGSGTHVSMNIGGTVGDCRGSDREYAAIFMV